MCGIFGHTAPNEFDIEFSRSALNTLEHRGPNQWGDYQDSSIYMGHRRLSIIDLSENGRQPMSDERKSVFASVNGEIYNFRELRKELEAEHAFRSNSDSEVVLHGYVEWGIEGLLDRIDGMFAFAIYDRTRQRLVLARDRVGIKPLYFAEHKNRVIWSSELKAIEHLLDPSELTIDETAAYDFLTYSYVPSPKTIYREVRKLPAGHFAEFEIDRSRLSAKRYWELRPNPRERSADDAREELRDLVGTSVRDHLVSDVPVGVFLSGGLDSTVIAAHARLSVDTLRSYSVAFREASHNEASDARETALLFGTDHEETIFGEGDAASLSRELRRWYDEPFGDASALPTFAVSNLAKQSSTVVLTGDGGDEVFGGYNWYQPRRRLENLSFLNPLALALKRTGRNNLAGRIGRVIEASTIRDECELHVRMFGGMLRDEKTKFRRHWRVPADYDDYWHFRRYLRPDLPRRTRLQFIDFHTYLPDNILTKVDRTTMAVSLEARVPLLSRALVEYAFDLPERLRFDGGRLKGLLRTAHREMIPVGAFERGKKGFGIPTRQWRRSLLAARSTYSATVLHRLYPEIEVPR